MGKDARVRAEIAESPWRRALVVVGIVVLSFNLRPAASSVGPVLEEIRADLGLSATVAGVLTSLPVVAFATFGALAPRLAHLVGLHRLTLLGLACMTAGMWLRSRVESGALFLALSLLALAGMATANVLMPSLVKLHFPRRIGLLTAVYSTAMAVGLTLASVLTVPIAQHYDGWRSGVAAWALTAAVAVLPWLGLVGHDLTPRETAGPIRLRDVARTRLGWMMALFFGLQSMQAYAVFGWFADIYRSAGFSAGTSGLLLGLITGMGIPLSAVTAALAARMRNQLWLLVALMVCYPVGYVGLIVAPRGGAVLWAVLVGIGLCTFPLILTLIGLRARSSAGTAALSGFTQSVGYLIAVLGPFGVGALHDLAGEWTTPLVALTAFCLPQLVVGIVVCRPAYLEDDLDRSVAESQAPASQTTETQTTESGSSC